MQQISQPVLYVARKPGTYTVDLPASYYISPAMWWNMTRGGTHFFSTYSWAIGTDVNNYNHYKCIKLGSQKKKLEGFSKFSQNKLFQAFIFGQKYSKKWNTSILIVLSMASAQGWMLFKDACHIFMGHGDMTTTCLAFASWEFLAGGSDLQHLTSTNTQLFDGWLTHHQWTLLATLMLPCSCEGNTMTRPLLLSEILQKGKLIGYEHTTD